jgi:hypothetical protein
MSDTQTNNTTERNMIQFPAQQSSENYRRDFYRSCFDWANGVGGWTSKQFNASCADLVGNWPNQCDSMAWCLAAKSVAGSIHGPWWHAAK